MQILLWIVALFVLEVNHLKWIWWEHWHCRACTVAHEYPIAYAASKIRSKFAAISGVSS